MVTLLHTHKIIFPQKLRIFRELEHCTRVLFVTPSSSHQQFPLLFTYFWKIPPQTCLVEANPSTLENISYSHSLFAHPSRLAKSLGTVSFLAQTKTVLPTFKYFVILNNLFRSVFNFEKVHIKPKIVENTVM